MLFIEHFRQHGQYEMAKLALEGYRALDLTDNKGFLCGRILGDLGCDVIKVEPVEGEPSRRIGPFYKNIPDPQKAFIGSLIMPIRGT